MDFTRLLKISLIVFAFIFFSNGYAATTARAIVCEQTYALCTSAACVPDPKNPHQSICDCVVKQGKSAGFTHCEKRKPHVDQYHATHLVSTFSFEQFATKKSLNCPKGKPWSNCVDMPCVIDPQNSSRAICLCELNASQAFFTFGGDCDNKACTTGFWSGATKGAASESLRDVLNSELKNPVSPNSCLTHSN